VDHHDRRGLEIEGGLGETRGKAKVKLVCQLKGRVNLDTQERTNECKNERTNERTSEQMWTYQKLNALNEFGKGVIAQGEPKVGQTKSYSTNQQDLENTKDTAQDGCHNVDFSPRPSNEPVLVRQDTEIEQNKGCNEHEIQLTRCKVQDCREILSPRRIADLQKIVEVDKAQTARLHTVFQISRH
jgi:hypothetical protein